MYKAFKVLKVTKATKVSKVPLANVVFPELITTLNTSCLLLMN
nr:MAG TPA: hypothetical protein [Caudoviricetes sp.]